MKKIPGEQYHIDISFFGQAHDLVKTFPTVIATNMIALVVTNVVVTRYENSNGICGWNVYVMLA